MGELALFVGGFAAGVFARSVYEFGAAPFVFIAMLAVLCTAAYFLKPRRAYALAALFVSLILAGMLRSALADTAPPPVFAAEVKQRVTYEGVVVGSPALKDATQQAEVAVDESGASTRILVTAARYPTFSAGERVQVSGTLEEPQAFADDNGRVFRYDRYLAREGIRFTMFGSLAPRAPAPWYSLPALLARIKSAFLAGLDRALPEPDASLAGGIVIGGKQGLGDALLADFTRSGLVQIIVLSGYNVMIVAEGVLIALAALKLPRRAAAAAAGAAVLLFVLIAGASSTALRALLMALIALYARASGRSYAAGRALFLVVFLMLLWRPLTLAFDPSFGLSVAATAGLIWLSPAIELRLAALRSAFWRGALATTLAAQLAVWPLLLYETGNFSPLSIPANLLVLPVVPAAMAAAALAGLGGMVLGPLASASALPAYLATRFIIGVARATAALPFAAFALPAFPFVFVLFAYGALALIASSKRFSQTAQLRLSKKASI
ncbi:MAG TPA: ComEC/Rec2 family competence protein [Candidatus Paceibacterota bacterium]|nr:ComEC/Rec2 family competence protein [Candidatus Paceibacterota bacterium]